MNQELLDRLQKADQATWEKIARGIPLKPCGQYFTYVEGKPSVHQFKDAYIPFGELMPEVALAWLQHCIQDAIRARKWLATVHAKSDESNHRCLARLDSEDDEIETVVEYGSTEAEALCLAYLEAIEAVA